MLAERSPHFTSLLCCSSLPRPSSLASPRLLFLLESSRVETRECERVRVRVNSKSDARLAAAPLETNTQPRLPGLCACLPVRR